jgi:DNA-binding CsgD family transcriptional regulator
MQNPQDHRLSSVRVHSKHPLVFHIIRRSLDPGRYEIKPFNPLAGNDLEGCNWVLILDTYTVEEWLELAVQCRLHGGRSIVILPEEEAELRLVYLGIHGAVPVPNVENELKHAVETVMEGRLWFRRSTLDEYVKRTQPAAAPSGSTFTLREEQIIAFLGRGLPNKQIGNTLGISERTVKFHVSNILRKCKVKSRKGLVSVQGRKEETENEHSPDVA